MLAADFLEANYDQVIWKTSNSKEKFSWIHIFFENNSSPPPSCKIPFSQFIRNACSRFFIGESTYLLLVLLTAEDRVVHKRRLLFLSSLYRDQSNLASVLYV